MANNKEAKNKKRFFKDFKAELKKVIWPTPKQLVNNTLAVVVIVIMTAVIVFALDFVFELFSKYGINNLKARVRGNEIVVEEHDHTHDHDHEVETELQNNVAQNEVVETNTVELDTTNGVEDNINE